MNKLIKLTLVGILIQAMETVASLYTLCSTGHPSNQEIYFTTMLLCSVLLYIIATNYLSFKKLLFFSLILSLSFSIFSEIEAIAREIGFFKLTYILTFGSVLYFTFAFIIAFIFNTSVISGIVLLKKAYSYIKTML